MDHLGKKELFGAIYWLMVKIGQSIALVLGGLILSIVGFDPGVTTQTLETMNNLRIADIVVPAGTAALAFIVMWKYDLNEERVRGIGAELKARNNKPKPRQINSLYSQNQMLMPLGSIDVAPNPKI